MTLSNDTEASHSASHNNQQKTIKAYTKPSQQRDFSKSAAKRASVMALGSISHLQHFYAKSQLIKPVLNGLTEEEYADANGNNIEFPPTPTRPSPNTEPFPDARGISEDPEKTLHDVEGAISDLLSAWKLVEGEATNEPLQVDVLSMVQTATRAVQAVRNYTLVRHDVTNVHLASLRTGALDVLDAVSRMESSHRRKSAVGVEDEYRGAEYDNVDKERSIVTCYLDTVDECLFGVSKSNGKQVIDENHTLDTGRKLESWAVEEKSPARNTAFLVAHLPSDTTIPSLDSSKAACLSALSDGRLLCYVYNSVVRRSRRPWGYITRIHSDTMRTYRATDNLKFFAAACKIRFDLCLDWDTTQINKLTVTGAEMLCHGIDRFCDVAIMELLMTGAAYIQSQPKSIRRSSGGITAGPLCDRTNVVDSFSDQLVEEPEEQE